MGFQNIFQRISKAPTNPHVSTRSSDFDVADLFNGPIAEPSQTADVSLALDEKLRQAYFWIINTAIISTHYDIEYNKEPPQSYVLGDSKSRLVLPTEQSYSSFVLLPLLSFAVRGKCLLVGGPGRGKTASAILMGILAGYPLKEVRRSMQHGHPQMTIADLLGNPLPADMVNAQSIDEIRISWRKWLGMRVKIIDEYNRIPTRTQSALLTVMGDNYAEILNHIYECPDAAWYLTANDDQGGGTYQVIEALRDRIDVIVQALAFNPRFIGELLTRIEENMRPEEVMPPELIFSQHEQDQMVKQIRKIKLPPEVQRRLEFFTSQFEFSEMAAEQFEYKTKDTVRLSGTDWNQVISLDNGRDRLKDLGCQTKNGLSVRNLMTLMLYSKALAFFRGNDVVDLEDIRQVLPFVLHDKLVPDLEAPFFSSPGNEIYKSDRIGWLRKLFDLCCREYDRIGLDNDDPVAMMMSEVEKGLDGVKEAEVRNRLGRIERQITEWSKGKKLYGPIHDDLLVLKYLHQRYTNYLRWLKTRE